MTTKERARPRRSYVMGLAHVLYRRDRAPGFGSALSMAWRMLKELEAANALKKRAA